MSSSGKENIEILDETFKDYFAEKSSSNRSPEILRLSRIDQIELHDFKFTCAVHSRNRNRLHHPLLS